MPWYSHIEATNKTAALAGPWCVAGMMVTEYLFDDSSVAFFVSSIPFFFVPILLYVFGLDNVKPMGISEGFEAIATPEYWRNFARIGLRMIVWFVASAITMFFVALIRGVINGGI